MSRCEDPSCWHSEYRAWRGCTDPSSPIASSVFFGAIFLVLGDAFGYIAWGVVTNAAGMAGAAILGALLAGIGITWLLWAALHWPAHKAQWHPRSHGPVGGK